MLQRSSQRIDVSLCGVSDFPIEATALRCSEFWAASTAGWAIPLSASKAKITDAEFAIGIYQKVVRLQISMENTALMEFLNAQACLSQPSKSLLFCHWPFLLAHVEQACLAKIEAEEEMCASFCRL